MNHNFNIICRHRRPLMLLNFLILLVTLLSATSLSNTLSPPVWKAKAKFNVPNSGGNLSADLGTLGSIKDSSTGFSKEVNPLEIQSTILKSDAVIGKIWDKDPERSEFPILKVFKPLFSIELLPQSTVLVLEAKGSSSDLALSRTTKLIKVYQQRLNELRRLDADSQQRFSHEELQKSKAILLKAEKELDEFRQATGIIDSNVQAQQLISSINELKTRLTLLQSEAEASQIKAEIAAGQFSITPEKAIQSLNLAENLEYQELRRKLTQTEIDLSDARSTYLDSSPQVQNLLFQRQQISQELKQRSNNLLPDANDHGIDLTLGNNSSTKRLDIIAESIASQTVSKGLQKQTIQIQNQIEKLTSELKNISTNKAKLIELERKHSIAEGVYKGIIAQTSRAKIDNFNSYPNVQLIDGPVLDPIPEGANKKLIVLGGLLACTFGSLSLILFLESSAPLLSPKDIRRLGLPVLYSLAHFPQTCLQSNSDLQLQPSENSDNILVSQNILGTTFEDYQEREFERLEFERLATTICSLELENNRLMITSAMPGEGKTTITLGLANALEKLGYRILLIDADTYKAKLSNYLRATSAIIQSINFAIGSVISFDNGLDLVNALELFQERSSQFFTQGNFDHYLEQVQIEGNYDYVLVDTPPINLTSKAMLMVPTLENVLFVTKPGTSDRNSVINSLDQLRLHKAKIQGLILNEVGSSKNNYYYEYASKTHEAIAALEQATLPQPSLPS